MLVTPEPDPLLVQMPAVLDAWHRQIDVVSDLVRNNIEALLSPFSMLMGRLQEENQTSSTLFGGRHGGHSLRHPLFGDGHGDGVIRVLGQGVGNLAA